MGLAAPCFCSFCFFFSSLRSLTLRSLALPMPPAWRMDSSRVARPPEGSTTSLGAPWTGVGRVQEAAQAGPGRAAQRRPWAVSEEGLFLGEETRGLDAACICPGLAGPSPAPPALGATLHRWTLGITSVLSV